MTDYGEYIVSMYCAQSGVKCEEIVRCRDCKCFQPAREKQLAKRP